MKHIIAVVAVVVASLAFAPTLASAAQATGSAKGTVSAIGTSTVTVKVAGKDMTFDLNDKTDVVAKGAGTSNAAAKKVGMAGVKFGDIVKVGDEVEVSHKDTDGKMLATTVLVTKKAATK